MDIPTTVPILVRALDVSDLDELVSIEAAVQPTPWPRDAYQHEIERNELAFYWAARSQSTTAAAFPPSLAALDPISSTELLGYAGYWMMVDEAHISIIAVDPTWQRHGIGELLLLTMLCDAIERGAEIMTLEVRLANTAAQALYLKYQFEIVGRRKRYYRDTNEDAHIMTVGEIQSERFHNFLIERADKLFARLMEYEE